MLTGTPLDLSLGGTDLLVFRGYMLQETGFLKTPGALPSLGGHAETQKGDSANTQRLSAAVG